MDNKGNRFHNSNSDVFQNVCNKFWKLRSVKQMLEDKIGHCYDQVEIEREWFVRNGYEIKTFWISAYQKEVKNSGFCHTYLVYKDKDVWKLFEHSDYFNKGIYKFNSLKDAVKWQSENQIKSAERCIKPQNKYVVCVKEYKKPPINLNMQEFMQFIENSENLDCNFKI